MYKLKYDIVPRKLLTVWQEMEQITLKGMALNIRIPKQIEVKYTPSEERIRVK